MYLGARKLYHRLWFSYLYSRSKDLDPLFLKILVFSLEWVIFIFTDNRERELTKDRVVWLLYLSIILKIYNDCWILINAWRNITKEIILDENKPSSLHILISTRQFLKQVALEKDITLWYDRNVVGVKLDFLFLGILILNHIYL